MGQLTITLSDQLEDEVRKKVQQGEYGSVSDFVRDAINGKLSYKPSYWERFTAAHVLENNKLLKELVPDRDLSNDELLTALQHGYPSRYNEARHLISSDELSTEGAHFVEDVLEMHGELQRACDVHKTNKELAKKVLFEGFDGNAGDGYLGYTSFLVDNGLYTYVKPLDKTPHLNSHSSVNSIYGRMLEEYKIIKGSRDRYKVLSLQEVDRIIAARIHPENR